MHRIVRVNAGGKLVQTLSATLLKYPDTAFASRVLSVLEAPSNSSTAGTAVRKQSKKRSVGRDKARTTERTVFADLEIDADKRELFLDVDPRVFDCVLGFLRTGRMVLPVNDEPLRSSVVHFLSENGLLEHAFPAIRASPSADEAQGGGEEVRGEEDVNDAGGMGPTATLLPDVCVVQLCDHMQHDQGVKRHALTISYGADGFRLRGLTKRIRKDLNTVLASTYWQVYQTNERAAFFVTTKVANGTADLMTSSITQQVIAHTEGMGYSLASSYVTLSPDVVHTNVRMLIHNFIFRRVRQPVLEVGDAVALMDADGEDDGSASRRLDDGDQVHPNFEPPAVGPQASMWGDAPTIVPEGQRMTDIWKTQQ